MKAVVCRFCGVVTDVPHDTQRACIEALQEEINRTRRILENVSERLPPASIAPEGDPQLT